MAPRFPCLWLPMVFALPLLHVRALRSSRPTPVCRGKALQKIASLTPKNIYLTAFDEKYAETAADYALKAASRGLTFVGACNGPTCAKTFKDRTAGKCSTCHVLDCAEYDVPIEPEILKSSFCQGWRHIQFTKVYAFHDFLVLGKNVLLTDLDIGVPHEGIFDSAQKMLGSKDFLILKRDPELMNFGILYARSSSGTRQLAVDLRKKVSHAWDQAAWNELMQEGELRGTVTCKVPPNDWTESMGLKKVKSKLEIPRCGLNELYGKHDDRHPKCVES